MHGHDSPPESPWLGRFLIGTLVVTLCFSICSCSMRLWCPAGNCPLGKTSPLAPTTQEVEVE